MGTGRRESGAWNPFQSDALPPATQATLRANADVIRARIAIGAEPLAMLTQRPRPPHFVLLGTAEETAPLIAQGERLLERHIRTSHAAKQKEKARAKQQAASP